MPYVTIPNDLSRIKTKVVMNLTKRQLICFGIAATIGIPTYLFTRTTIGNAGAMMLMIALMLPAFLFAMYEKDGLPFEKVARNIIRATFLRPGRRLYKTDNLYQWIVDSGQLTVTKTIHSPLSTINYKKEGISVDKGKKAQKREP